MPILSEICSFVKPVRIEIGSSGADGLTHVGIALDGVFVELCVDKIREVCRRLLGAVDNVLDLFDFILGQTIRVDRGLGSLCLGYRRSSKHRKPQDSSGEKITNSHF